MAADPRNWSGFAEHASIEAIDARLRTARASVTRWQQEVRRLEDLRGHRAWQIQHGQWPAARQHAEEQS